MNNLDAVYAEKIASEYIPKPTSKVAALKKLHNKAKMPALVFAYVFGIAGTLLFGTAMCLCLNVIGFSPVGNMVLGIVLGVIAAGMLVMTYPLYNQMLRRGKRKYAHDIIELAKQISDEQ